MPDKMSGLVDVEDADNPSGFEARGADLSDVEARCRGLTPQADQFTCLNCFLVKHRSQLDHETKLGPICLGVLRLSWAPSTRWTVRSVDPASPPIRGAASGVVLMHRPGP